MSVFSSQTPASRFVVGIDLGTTNSAIAYVDTSEPNWRVRDFSTPQLVGPGEVDARDTLPSFHYEPAAGELPAGALKLPWDQADPGYCVGFFARDHGAAVPGRLVVSAKSWLCHLGVDRTAALLPWHGPADVQRLSPVQVSARYLLHMRRAWDHHFPEHPLAEQDLILTVPASFDEVARELTVEAAVQAGLQRAVLVEEPQAAFYAWIDANKDWESRVKPGQKILVCDVGGGTTDFTLIRVRPAEAGKVLFHRIAVGDHLILGGDNLDLALAHHIEKKVVGGWILEPRRWGPLVRTCRQVKETLLGPNPPPRLTINVAGGGSKLIGGAVRVEVTAQEVQDLLMDGFLPRVTLAEKPAARRSGFQEFGLPYAPDPAITRYLAAFLNAHRHAGDDAADRADAAKLDHDPARPDLVLFNGGLFASPFLRQRLLDVLASWFPQTSEKPWAPVVLENARLDLAVARGAAHYGMVRRGHGVRISGGSAQSYYIAVESAHAAQPVAVCLLPTGIEEGHGVELRDRAMELLIRRPAEFQLYVSSTRTNDKPGDLVTVDPLLMTALPPIRTVLQSGKKAAADSVPVYLNARRTEIGTLDLWCAEIKGDRQWRLQFDVRSASRAAAAPASTAEAQGVMDQSVVEPCAALIRHTFGVSKPDAAHRPEGLIKRLEHASAMGRLEWPSSLMRAFWEVLMEVEAGRRLGVEYEARWLNLTGFSLRPGYGLAVDDFRVAATWRLFPLRVIHPKNELCKAEWWILWRRLAGGLTRGHQRTLVEPFLSAFHTWQRKAGKGGGASLPYGSHELAEIWRLIGSLELLPVATKLELGEILFWSMERERAAVVREAAIWALGRLGTRVPIYGPLNELIPADAAENWAKRLIDADWPESKSPFSLMQLTRLTADRYRDVSPAVREAALAWLANREGTAHYQQLVRAGGQLEDEEQKLAFGESLPRGLRIE